MDLPTLKAFVSPRNFSLRAASSEDQFKSCKTKLTSKDKGKCPSSRMMKTTQRGALNQYIKDLQGSIFNDCKRLEEKIKSVHQKAPSNLSKQNINQHNTIFKSCQNLKKYSSKTLLDKSSKQEASLKRLKKSNQKASEETLRVKQKSKEGYLQKFKSNLQLTQQTDWVPNKKLEGLLGHVYTTTNALSRNFDKDTPKPKIIRSLFHNKINSEDQLGIRKFKSDLSIKDFRIVRKLGKGRFGNVYLAQDKLTGFLVAIKSLQKKAIKENDMIRQVKQEIKIQLYLDHPNVLKMYGFFDDFENIYLIIQAIPLGNVFRELKDQKRFSQKKSAGYLKQVCEGLGCLHHSKILHRDIKPENILNGYGVLKLSDFGWSIYSPQENRETFCGTLDYVSPEIVVGKSYDFMVDVWSIGVLAFQFVTGFAPFENKGGTQDQTYQRILKTKINYPQYLSEGVKDFVNRILVKNPKKRMSLCESTNHEWLVQNCKGGNAVSKSIFTSYQKLM